MARDFISGFPYMEWNGMRIGVTAMDMSLVAPGTRRVSIEGVVVAGFDRFFESPDFGHAEYGGWRIVVDTARNRITNDVMMVYLEGAIDGPAMGGRGTQTVPKAETDDLRTKDGWELRPGWRP